VGHLSSPAGSPTAAIATEVTNATGGRVPRVQKPDPSAAPPEHERLADPEPLAEDREEEPKLRPRELDEFVGQPAILEQLRIFLEAAKRRNEALDHVQFHGPPGLGQATL